jgi:hypothetical protein
VIIALRVSGVDAGGLDDELDAAGVEVFEIGDYRARKLRELTAGLRYEVANPESDVGMGGVDIVGALGPHWTKSEDHNQGSENSWLSHDVPPGKVRLVFFFARWRKPVTGGRHSRFLDKWMVRPKFPEPEGIFTRNRCTICHCGTGDGEKLIHPCLDERKTEEKSERNINW